MITGDNVADLIQTRIGIRQIEWKPEGFFINGERLILNGAIRHQDGIHVGNALPANVQRLDAKRIREGGFNNIRAGHYPLDRAFMDACDEFGLTVVACIPGRHWFQDSKTFKNNSYQDVRDLIRRDRNHPSVVLYEPILNESRYTKAYAKKTYRISKQEDPNSFAACDYKRLGHETYDVIFKAPDGSKPLFTREWGDAVRRTGKGDAWGRRDSESPMVYQSISRQRDLNGDGYWDWQGVHKNPDIGGYALWTGIDHNRGNYTSIARCGVWGLDRYPKFCMYFLQSQRDPAIDLEGLDSGPMVFIGSYWRESSFRDVSVYSNREQVRLFLNDKLIATRTPDTTYDAGKGVKPVNHVTHPIFTFESVPWEPGTLRAEGLIAGEVVTRHQVRTPGEPERLTIEMDHLNPQLTADGSDMAMLFIKAVDRNGTLVPDFEGEIHVDVGGAGRLIGANPVMAEGGVAAIWLRSKTSPGKASVSATSEGLGTATFATAIRKSDDTFVSAPDLPEPKRIRRVEASAVTAKEIIHWRIEGLKVKASSSRPGSDPARMLDGNRESWWIAAANRDQWVELELPEPATLAGRLMVREKDSTWYDFTISVSSDGKDWKQVYRDSQTGHDFQPEDWRANDVRFVRLHLPRVSPSDSLLGIGEIELYAN